MDVDNIPHNIRCAEPRNRFLAMEMETLYTTINQREKLLDNLERVSKKEIFDIFDEYSCIKNDKWYKELKEKHIGSQKTDKCEGKDD